MARILVSGASGFIGTPLISFLASQGAVIIQLVRPSERKPPSSIVWDPEGGSARARDFEDFDAVIHLAGEPLTLARWSAKKQRKILESRKGGTMFLSHLLSKAISPPRLFLSASAVGYYGDRGDEILNEESEPGSGFLAHV
jgi:NAD dependent epimerase/dehydratase family enzyme